MDEQAGILAQELKENTPCPVCGSLEHPHPAEKSQTAPTKEELDFFRSNEQSVAFEPTIVTDVYKVRSGEWNQLRIWSDANLGNLRKKDLFATNSRLEVVPVGTDFKYQNCWEKKDMSELIEQLKIINGLE